MVLNPEVVEMVVPEVLDLVLRLYLVAVSEYAE